MYNMLVHRGLFEEERISFNLLTYKEVIVIYGVYGASIDCHLYHLKQLNLL